MVTDINELLRIAQRNAQKGVFGSDVAVVVPEVPVRKRSDEDDRPLTKEERRRLDEEEAARRRRCRF